MRTIPFGSLVAVAIAFTTPAFAQEAKQDFRLVNRTGYELKEVYVGPNSSDEWGNDILGQDVLENNQAVNIHFSPKVKTCKWDLKVVYTVDESKAVWKNIDLCNIDKITIHYDKDRDVTRATFD